jgi:hypothetical protein
MNDPRLDRIIATAQGRPKPRVKPVKRAAPKRVVRRSQPVTPTKSFRERELEVQMETVKALERVELARAYAKRHAEPVPVHIHQAPQTVTFNGEPLELVDDSPAEEAMVEARRVWGED